MRNCQSVVGFLFVPVLILGGLLGCRSTPDDAKVRQEATGAPLYVEHPAVQIRLNSVGFLQPYLNKVVAVEQTGADRTDTNTLQAYVVLRNRTGQNAALQARTQFFSTERIPSEGPGEWQSVFLSPRSVETVRMNSIGKDHAYYYIEIQEHP